MVRILPLAILSLSIFVLCYQITHFFSALTTIRKQRKGTSRESLMDTGRTSKAGSLSPHIGSLLSGYTQWIDSRILLAGGPFNLSSRDVLWIKWCIGIFLGGTLYILEVPLFIVLLFFCVGFLLPDIWLNDRVKKRQKEIIRDLPYFLDLLTLSIEAGLDFVAGVERVNRSMLQGSQVSAEFQRFLNEISVGVSRKKALRGLASRIRLPEIDNFVTSLIQADQFGASLATTLRIQSEELRNRRFQRAEKCAMQAPVKLLFPLIGFIMWGVFLILLGPPLITYFMRGSFY
jgi:tight adherence protein C